MGEKRNTDVSAAHGHQNGGFSTSVGFILACVGSAVGMGNIWMFPYRVGQYGGAAFLVPYLIFITIFGLVGLSAEFAVGRRAKTGTLGSYEYCWKSRGKGKLGYILGWIPLMGSLGIAIGYAIIVGWVVRSLAGSLTNTILTTDAAEYFAQATGAFGSIPWHLIVILAAMGILMFGVASGIEKINKVLMPSFFILFAVLAVRVAFLPGAAEGYKFLFVPKWEYLLKVDTWVMAMGQAFFSLSITGSGMIVYGTYLGKDEDIPKSSVQTALFDTLAAMLAALAIMPAVFAFGIKPNAGPPLMFITLPNIFRQMPMGQLFSVLFFVSVAFAGITSLVNMFEAVCESWQNRFKLSRKAAVALCGIITFGVGLFLEAEPKVGSWMDFITIIVVPFGAVLGAVSIYYILGFNEIKKELESGREKPLSGFFGPLAKFVYVPLAVIVFVLGIMYGGIG
ncbi:sodium-dependent transporter [Clostridium sp. MCC353]|uniref:sodium-dependent transporter n=1 Tax=Clostridium sp. MCC353 TaxID=2592646 RepID=UPI001C0312A8|nr:sodium-dependent transporter [Clostridium sp. MCC353]MBT9778032.1 sodium-dependent transporter [Clostridium sp. MCC353]